MIATRLSSCLLAVAVTAAITPASFSQSSGQGGEKVWYWFSDCQPRKMMGVEVVLDGKSVYRTEFRICALERNGQQSAGSPNIRKAFYFGGGHTFQGEYHTTERQRIEGNIWQAGADPDALLLGVSFMTKNQILLNTLHVAKPDKATGTMVDPGVVVRTYPLKSPATPSAK